RLLDSKGKPAAGVVVTPSIDLRRTARKDRKDLPGDLMYFAGASPFPQEQGPYPAPVTTDAKGQFTVTGLLPGIKYVFNWFPKAPGGGSYLVELATLSLEAGSTTKDLGDLKPTVPPDVSFP